MFNTDKAYVTDQTYYANDLSVSQPRFEMWIEDNYGANIQDWKTEYWTAICNTTNAAKGFQGYDVEAAVERYSGGLLGFVLMYLAI